MSKIEEFGKLYIYFVFILWFSTEVLFNSTIEYIFAWKKSDANSVMAVAILVLLLVHIVLFQRYQMREIIIIAIVSALMLQATILSGNNLLLSTWIFVIASKYIDMDKIVGMAYYVQLIMVLFVLYMFFSGYITENIVFRGNVARHSLGFIHPNQLGIRVFLIIVCRCYHRKKRLNIIDVVIILLGATFINIVANSLTAYYSLILLAIITILYLLMIQLKSNMVIAANLLILLSVCSNVLSVLFSIINIKQYGVLKDIDAFMSHRFSQCHRTISFYGIKLLGQVVQLIVKNPYTGKIYHFWLDNAYVAILLRYGAVVYVVFSVLYLVTMIYLKETQQYYLLCIMCMYSIYGIMENNFFAMAQNIFLLSLSFPIYKVKRMKGLGILSRVKLVW